MKTRERRKVKEEVEDATQVVVVRGARSHRVPRPEKWPGGVPRTDAEFGQAIDEVLRQIKEVRAETRKDDEEMARLGEETRHYLREIHRTLNADHV